MGLRPLLRRCQAGAAVEEAAFAAVGLPLARGLGELALEPQAGAVGVDPFAEPAPAADQSLVGHFDRTLARGLGVALGRDQAGVGQAADDGFDGQRVGAGRDQFAERGPALGVLDPLAGLGQPEEDPPAESRARSSSNWPRTSSARFFSAPCSPPIAL